MVPTLPRIHPSKTRPEAALSDGESNPEGLKIRSQGSLQTRSDLIWCDLILCGGRPHTWRVGAFAHTCMFASVGPQPERGQLSALLSLWLGFRYCAQRNAGRCARRRFLGSRTRTGASSHIPGCRARAPASSSVGRCVGRQRLLLYRPNIGCSADPGIYPLPFGRLRLPPFFGYVLQSVPHRAIRTRAAPLNTIYTIALSLSITSNPAMVCR